MVERSPGAVGASRTPAAAGGLDGVRRPSRRAATPEAGVRGFDASPERQPAATAQAERPQKQYVHVEGRRFDLSAPRGTYLDILV